MNSELKGVMISIMALVVAGGMSAYNTSEVKATQEQVQVQVEQQFTPADVFTTLENNKGKLNGLIEFPEEKKFNDKLLIEALNVQGKKLRELEMALNVTENQIRLLNNKMLVVEALQNKVSQAVPQGEEMFQLILLKSDGNTVPSGEFLQSETIYISGHYTGGHANKFDIMFKKTGQLIYERTGLNMPTDGVFAYYFNEGHNVPVGQYTATVIINGKIDTVSFEIV